MTLDPLQNMWDALHQAGCEPLGDPHSFDAFCPGHGGRSHRNLHVGEGSDGRVLLTCHAGCDWRGITSALGMDGRALFPVGHRNGRRARPAPRTPLPLSEGAAFLDSLLRAGFVWRAMVALPRCPYCEGQRCVVWVHEAGGLDVECPDGCLADEVRRAIETRAAIAEKTGRPHGSLV